jgi:hypothetical protein
MSAACLDRLLCHCLQGFALLCVSYPQSDCTVLSEMHALNPLMK